MGDVKKRNVKMRNLLQLFVGETEPNWVLLYVSYSQTRLRGFLVFSLVGGVILQQIFFVAV
jgi:hypothetical protein